MEAQNLFEPLASEDLFPAWCWIDDLERAGVIGANDALQWKLGIFELMEQWGLGPDDLVSPCDDPTTGMLR